MGHENISTCHAGLPQGSFLPVIHPAMEAGIS